MAQFSLKNTRLMSKFPIPTKKSNVHYYPKGTIFVCKGIHADSLDQHNSSDKNWQMGVDYGFRLTVEGGRGEINVPSSMLYMLFDPIDGDGNVIVLE